MAHRKTATKTEKEIIDRLAHAFVCEDIANDVIEFKTPGLEKEYRQHMRKNCPQFYRLFDELQRAIPRVRKQMLAQFQKDMKSKT